MDNLYFGEIIRLRREELNMNQHELCEGVCNRTVLSRIERGAVECSKYLAEIFLQRLGLPMDFYYASSNKTGIEQLKIKNKINDAIRQKKTTMKRQFTFSNHLLKYLRTGMIKTPKLSVSSLW